jgi:hypothetical protein
MPGEGLVVKVKKGVSPQYCAGMFGNLKVGLTCHPSDPVSLSRLKGNEGALSNGSDAVGPDVLLGMMMVKFQYDY